MGDWRTIHDLDDKHSSQLFGLYITPKLKSLI